MVLAGEKNPGFRKLASLGSLLCFSLQRRFLTTSPPTTGEFSPVVGGEVVADSGIFFVLLSIKQRVLQALAFKVCYIN